MDKKLINYFDELFNNNKIGHAFLIANIDYNNLKETLERIFFDYFFHRDLKIDDNPDIFIIQPSNNVIKKEQINDLHAFLNSTSQISGKKIYIINNCELMNVSSANSLLKILEEPEDNIYAFLFTNNINNVLPTIRSRCQNIFVSSSLINDKDEFLNMEKVHIAKEFVSIIIKYKGNALPYIVQLLGKKISKEELAEILSVVEKLYKEIFDLKIKGKIENFVNEKEFIEKISHEIDNNYLVNVLLVLNKNIQNFNYNLNNSLLLDKLVIDLGRC